MLHASMLAALRWFGVPPRGELVVVLVVLLLLTPATVLACHYKVILLRPCAPFPWPFSKQTRDAQMALLPPQPFIFILGAVQLGGISVAPPGGGPGPGTCNAEPHLAGRLEPAVGQSVS